MNTPQLDPLTHQSATSGADTTERARIAKDLHDGIGQTLTGLKLDVAWLSRRLAEQHVPAITQRLYEMSDTIDAAIEDVRRIARGLQPSALEHEDFGVAIETQARKIAKRAGVQIFVDTDFEINLPIDYANSLYRISQEALSNIVRHAQASSVWLSLTQSKEHVELHIRDDGRGIPNRDHQGSGLRNMRERAESMGAQFKVQSAQSGGTVLSVLLPLPNASRPSTSLS